MTHRLLAWLAPVIATLALTSGCKDQNEPTSSTRTTSGAAEPSPPPAANPEKATAPQLADEDRKFLTEAAQGGLLEVQLGRDVVGRATSPIVKQFAQRMVDDHGKANDELRRLAAAKGATLPIALDDDKRDMLTKVSKLQGPKLDKQYAADMVDDHAKDVADFQDAAKNLKDPDIRAWAAKTVPVLEAHLSDAKSMKQEVKKE
jgi:putative membrane protein